MMEPTAKPRDFLDFTLFLEKHRYLPQGRFSRVGAMKEQDMENLLRGKLLPMWRWAFATIKNESDTKLIKRNIDVARKQIQSYRGERDAARNEHLRLDARKKYSKDCLDKENRKQQELLQKLTALEQEKTRKLQKAQEKKEQEILCQSNENCRLTYLNTIRDRLYDCGKWLRKSSDSLLDQPDNLQLYDYGADSVLKKIMALRESALNDYAAENGSVKFTMIEDFRSRDYKSVLDALMKLVAADRIGDEKLCPSEGTDNAQHCAKEIITILTSEKTIQQVQDLLCDLRKEHISNYLQTERIYSQADMLYEKIRLENESASSDNYKLSLYASSEADGAEVPSQTSGDALDRLSQLELLKSVTSAVLQRTRELYDQIVLQVEGIRQRKSDLDQQIVKVRTYQQREREAVCRLQSYHAENQALLHSIQQTQQKSSESVCEVLMTLSDKAAVHGRLTRYRALLQKESRYFSSVHLSEQQIVVLRSKESTKVFLPRKALYITQIQNESETATKQSHVTLHDVFQSLGVPYFGNWMLLFEYLEKANMNSSLVQELHWMLSRLENEFISDKTSGQQDGSHHARQILAEVSSICRHMESVTTPVLLSSFQVATATVDQGIPALQNAITTWATEPAWNVNLSMEDGNAIRN